MPLSAKGKKTLAEMKKHYGAKKGKQVFYATENKRKGKGLTKAADGAMVGGAQRLQNIFAALQAYRANRTPIGLRALFAAITRRPPAEKTPSEPFPGLPYNTPPDPNAPVITVPPSTQPDGIHTEPYVPPIEVELPPYNTPPAGLPFGSYTKVPVAQKPVGTKTSGIRGRGIRLPISGFKDGGMVLLKEGLDELRAEGLYPERAVNE